jgi:hypothetical protein
MNLADQLDILANNLQYDSANKLEKTAAVVNASVALHLLKEGGILQAYSRAARAAKSTASPGTSRFRQIKADLSATRAPKIKNLTKY